MSACRICSGRLLHSVGLALAKQRSPNWLCDLLTKHIRLSADRRGRRPAALTSVHLSAACVVCKSAVVVYHLLALARAGARPDAGRDPAAGLLHSRDTRTDVCL